MALSLAFAQGQKGKRVVPVLTIDGAIGPATTDYVVQAIAAARDERAPMILIRMDTPGGLDNSMRGIIRAIVNAKIPVVTYVSPSGARAASAGAFILTASHVGPWRPGPMWERPALFSWGHLPRLRRPSRRQRPATNHHLVDPSPAAQARPRR
ncbi:hypothetical protein [Sphingobium sp. HDIP04]|uniref:hypothetical protein n=1 Tax=Sphingobium sp. HDIP04 TaxID=428994 RepID=UPI003FD40DAB